MPRWGTSRFWRLRQYPVGEAFADAFSPETGPVPTPGEGEVLVRNEYISLDVEQALSRIEGGIDVYFDNVGGPLLDAVLPNMAHYGRVAVCGLVATYAADRATPGPRRFDQVRMRRLTIAGFFSPDFAQLKPWLRAGRITLPFDITTGLENVLAACSKLFTGGNIGKVVVKLT